MARGGGRWHRQPRQSTRETDSSRVPRGSKRRRQVALMARSRCRRADARRRRACRRRSRRRPRAVRENRHAPPREAGQATPNRARAAAAPAAAALAAAEAAAGASEARAAADAGAEIRPDAAAAAEAHPDLRDPCSALPVIRPGLRQGAVRHRARAHGRTGHAEDGPPRRPAAGPDVVAEEHHPALMTCREPPGETPLIYNMPLCF
mmetsp:Transcript_4512/g.13791  ORF Transcript_4512/g.13791 Transcript_4512/m.13791 type:complete len:206 (-) Transcript_4512:5-622(-)